MVLRKFSKFSLDMISNVKIKTVMTKNKFKRLVESNSARDQKRSEIQIDRAQISIKPSNLIFSISKGLKYISLGVSRIDKNIYL